MSSAKSSGLGDDQGTRVGAPDPSAPPTHPDSPPARPEQTTGTGAEATTATDGEPHAHNREHRSGYGGAGGKPVTSSDTRE